MSEVATPVPAASAASGAGRYAAVAAEFDAAIIGSLRPFQSDPDLDRQFDKMFDGVEVLPEDLWSEYARLTNEGNYIQAGELLVPISYQQLARISQARKRTSEKGERLITVDIPYNSEMGLDLSVLKVQTQENDL